MIPPGQEGTAFFFLVVGAGNPADAGRLLCRCLRAFIPHPVIAIQPDPHLPASSCNGTAPAVGQAGGA
jgi:hypothetical protein